MNAPFHKVQLTADLIEAFAGTFLSPRYDSPRPTPQFHREAWALYASSHPQVGCAAPRDHAKSTGLTFDYTLAEMLFRTSDYGIIISSTEEKGAEQLSNLSEELHDNEDLRREFGIAEFESDQKTDIVVRMLDGHRFRIIARGGEQKIRGALWNGKRPNLIVCDDMEDDEQVESRDRRRKFRRWFFRAAKQALSKTGKIRVHGTILHEDSLLARLCVNKTWKFLFYKAHRGFDDFAEILWPQRWSEEQLRQRRQEFIEDGDAAGYSQEFLNTPLDSSDAYLRSDDFIAMSEDDYETEKVVCAAADFAVSKADMANRTSFSIGGKDANNLLHFLDQRVSRWDSKEIIEEMFSIQKRWNPDIFWVEDGVIWKALAPIVYSDMQEKDVWINIVPRPSIKDKATRGRPLQRRMRAGGCRFDTKASWYPGMQQELLKFTGASQATLDDQFDSAALLAAGFETMGVTDSDTLKSDEEYEFERSDPRVVEGRSLVTGY